MNRKQYKNKVISKTLACLMAAVLSINMYPTSRVWADEEGTEDTEAAAEAEDGAAPVMIEEEAPPIEDPYLKNRLLVETDTPDIFRDGEVILSDYQGVYLVGFKTAEEMDEAYDYYKSEADIVEYDSDIMAVSDEDSGEENGVSEDAPTDSITILNDIVTDGGCPQGTIAVIDTGAGEGAAEYISVIGEDGGDDHGHGSRESSWKIERQESSPSKLSGVTEELKRQIYTRHLCMQSKEEYRTLICQHHLLLQRIVTLLRMRYRPQ